MNISNLHTAILFQVILTNAYANVIDKRMVARDNERTYWI